MSVVPVRVRAAGALALLVASALPAAAQSLPDSVAFRGRSWRNVGPNRGGRSLAGGGSAWMRFRHTLARSKDLVRPSSRE